MAYRSRKSGGLGRRLLTLLGLGAVAYGAWLGYAFFTGGATTAAADTSADPAQPIAARINAAETSPAEAAGAAPAAPTFTRVPGGAAFASQDFATAARQLDEYLAQPDADYPDEARLHLARALLQAGRPGQAQQRFQEILDLYPQSNYRGDAVLGLANVATANGEQEKADRLLLKAFREHPDTTGGAQAALRLADRWHAKFVEQTEAKTHWAEIRDAYSVALHALRGDPRRDEVISRLRGLNEYLIFGKGVVSNGIEYYTVQPGDALSRIAHRRKVTMGSIMRLNNITKPHLIRVGQKLKLLSGQAHLVVDKRHLTITLFINGRFFSEYPVGIGPDNATPTGTFIIETKVVNPTWYPSNGGAPIPTGDPRNILGTRWLGFERAGDGAGIGIHGTTRPESVPGRESAGCVRMLNDNVEELFDWVPRGTKVRIID